MILDYNDDNLKLVSDLIIKNLTPDLLPKKWVERNSTNPTFGHCHTSSGCLQKIFGTKNIKLHRALDDEGIWHWWVIDKEGKLIDLTADQYFSHQRKPPYESGTKASILGFEYRKRVQRLLDKVTADLISNGTPLL